MTSHTVILDLEYALENGVTLRNQTVVSRGETDRLYADVTNGYARIETDDLSNETRATFGSADVGLSGVAGPFVRRTEADEYLSFRGDNYFYDTKTSLGLYSELTWRLADRWSFTGGLRYQRDRIERTGTSAYVNSDVAFGETFDAVLPKIPISYEAAPNVVIGAMANRATTPAASRSATTAANSCPSTRKPSGTTSSSGAPRCSTTG